MIISSANSQDKAAMWNFLRMVGVPLPKSEDFMAIGRLNATGRLIGVVAFNGFVGSCAHMHTGGVGNWVNRDLLIQSFNYPFVQLKLNYLFATVDSDNYRALKFDRHIGFKDWQILPEGSKDGRNLHILRMRRNECKWIQPDVVARLQRKVAA